MWAVFFLALALGPIKTYFTLLLLNLKYGLYNNEKNAQHTHHCLLFGESNGFPPSKFLWGGGFDGVYG